MWLPRWLFVNKKKEPVVVPEKRATPMADLYEKEGKGIYRVYLTEYGTYRAQIRVDSEPHDELDTRTNGRWMSLSKTAGTWPAHYFATDDEAEACCREHAKEREKMWLAAKSAGVVRNLGKLP